MFETRVGEPGTSPALGGGTAALPIVEPQDEAAATQPMNAGSAGGAAVLAELLAVLENKVRPLCAQLTPGAMDDVSGSTAVEALDLLGPVLASQDGVRLTLLGIIDAENRWALDGSRSPTAWLSRFDRSSTRAAGSDLKLARGLRLRLPLTAEALLAGELPAEHARVLSRWCLRSTTMIQALADEKRGEQWLLDHAGYGLDEFTRFVARWCDTVDPQAADDRYREARSTHYLDVAQTLDGTHLQGFLEPTVGEALLVALRAETGVPSADDTRTPGRRRHDAFASLTTKFLADPDVRVTSQVRPQVVVHVDWATVTAEPDEVGALPKVAPATLQDCGTPLAPSQLGRLLCDAEVTRIVFGPDSEVLDVGRAQRTFTAGRRRALDARDGGCRAPNCDQPIRQCEGHHITSWQHGGATSVDNGVLLCWSCHDGVHRTGTVITHTDDGGLRFDTPGGPRNLITYPRHLDQLLLV